MTAAALDRQVKLARIRTHLVHLRLELSGLNAFHCADLIAAVIHHMDRKADDAIGNRRINV